VYGGADRVREMFESQPGTYVLTDFLARSFHRSVIVELGLDRHPELRDAYFAHYTRMVWLAQQPDDQLLSLAQEAADRIGLPLTVVPTGHSGLERALTALLALEPLAVEAALPKRALAGSRASIDSAGDLAGHPLSSAPSAGRGSGGATLRSRRPG
jgi:hypothetical protein